MDSLARERTRANAKRRLTGRASHLPSVCGADELAGHPNCGTTRAAGAAHPNKLESPPPGFAGGGRKSLTFAGVPAFCFATCGEVRFPQTDWVRTSIFESTTRYFTASYWRYSDLVFRRIGKGRGSRIEVAHVATPRGQSLRISDRKFVRHYPRGQKAACRLLQYFVTR
jgi:hypothetical protein